MMWGRRSGVVCGLVLAAAAGGAAQELTMVSKRTVNDQAPETITTYISTDKVRMAGAEKQEFIAELATGRFTMIDHKKREYSVITRQELEAFAAQAQAQLKQAQQQMESLPPQLREKMGKAMGALAASFKVEKGTGTRKVLGYTCQNWNMSWGEMFRQEQCVTSEIPVSPMVWDAQKAFFGAVPGAGEAFQKMADEMKKMNGMPIAGTSTVSVMGRSERTSWEMVDLKKGPIPASAWEVPAGYKQINSPMTKALKK
jgi:hypothetical protein